MKIAKWLFLVVATPQFLFSSSSLAMGQRLVFETNEFRSQMGEAPNKEIAYDLLHIAPFEDKTGSLLPVGRVVIDIDGSSCSGTLISPNQVLTAAHCLESSPSRPPMPSVPEFHLDNGMKAKVTTITYYSKPKATISGEYYDRFAES